VKLTIDEEIIYIWWVVFVLIKTWKLQFDQTQDYFQFADQFNKAKLKIYKQEQREIEYLLDQLVRLTDEQKEINVYYFCSQNGTSAFKLYLLQTPTSKLNVC